MFHFQGNCQFFLLQIEQNANFFTLLIPYFTFRWAKFIRPSSWVKCSMPPSANWVGGEIKSTKKECCKSCCVFSYNLWFSLKAQSMAQCKTVGNIPECYKARSMVCFVYKGPKTSIIKQIYITNTAAGTYQRHIAYIVNLYNPGISILTI